MRPASLFIAALLAVSSVAACAPSGGGATPVPTVAPTPAVPPVSAAVLQTRAAIVTALGEHNLTLRDTEAPNRPAEAPLLVSAPRAVYQAILPDDPDKGLIVVYEFADAARAAEAAAEQQRYLETGPGLVQVPEGSVQVLRGVGNTVILYDWLPAAAQDEAAPLVQDALETLGIGYPVTR